MPVHRQKPEVRGRLQVPCSLHHSSQKLELGWLSERFSYLPASASTLSAGVGGMCVVTVRCIPGCLGFKCKSACLCSKCSYPLSPFPVSGDSSLPLRELRHAGDCMTKKQEPCVCIISSLSPFLFSHVQDIPQALFNSKRPHL